MIAIPIILFFIPLVVKLINNFKKWKATTPVNHNKEWKWVALSELFTSGIFFFVLDEAEGDLAWFIIKDTFIIAGMLASWYWLLFDGLYNLIRLYWAKKCSWYLRKGQYKFWYTGSDDKDDATTDNILQRLKLWQHIALKLGLVILFTYLYII